MDMFVYDIVVYYSIFFIICGIQQLLTVQMHNSPLSTDIYGTSFVSGRNPTMGLQEQFTELVALCLLHSPHQGGHKPKSLPPTPQPQHLCRSMGAGLAMAPFLLNINILMKNIFL